MADPLTAACPDCQAPPSIACRGHAGTHADRQLAADLRALEQGTCSLCGAWLVRGSVEGSDVDAWHPEPVDAARCPPMPNPAVDWNAYAEALNAGTQPGHPGLEHFIPATAPQDPQDP